MSAFTDIFDTLLYQLEPMDRDEGWHLGKLREAIQRGDGNIAMQLALEAYQSDIQHPVFGMMLLEAAWMQGRMENVRRLFDELEEECAFRGLLIPPWPRFKRIFLRFVDTLRQFVPDLQKAPGYQRRRTITRHTISPQPAQGSSSLLRSASTPVKSKGQASKPARGRAGKGGARAGAGKGKTAQAVDMASVAPPPPPGPPGFYEKVRWLPDAEPRVTLPKLQLSVEANHLLERLGTEPNDGLAPIVLAREAIKVQRARHYDEILCLTVLNEVRHYPHQIETARRVLRDLHGRALLADEVGLGKTIEAGIIIKEYMLRGLARSVLILCPPSLVEQWQGEMESKFGLSFRVPDSDSRSFFEVGDLHLCSIAFARREENLQRAIQREYDMVVVDEAHHVKNRNTLGFKLVDQLKRRFLLLLTATPVQNQLSELYDLVTLLRPGFLGTRSEFSSRFVAKGDPRKPKNQDGLRELLSQVMIRNTRALVDVRLPPRFVRTVTVEPTGAELQLYSAISEYVRDRAREATGLPRMLLMTLLAEVGSSAAAVLSTLENQLAKKELSSADAASTRELERACLAIGPSSKARLLLDLLHQSAGEKTAIFVKYRATLASLEGALQAAGVPMAVFHGGMSGREKEEAIDRFRDRVPVLLSTEIGGEGRNLQFCHRLINYDLPWNPFAIEQRIGRFHRIGQEQEVHVTNLCARGTLEDHLMNVLDQKLNMFELVIGELDMILGQMEGDVDIPNRVFSIWTGATNEEGLARGFEELGHELVAARGRYEETRAVDQAIFGCDYEAA